MSRSHKPVPLRRSTRISRRVSYVNLSCTKFKFADIDTHHCYPDGPPETEFEQTIDSLNCDMLPSQSYAAVDDIIVYGLFSSKRRSRSYRSWTATATSTISTRTVTAKDGIAIADLCHSNISWERPTIECCRQTAIKLHQLCGNLFHGDEINILQQ